MTHFIYEAEKSEVRYLGTKCLDFYCGEALDETAILLINLSLGKATVQETYTLLIRKELERTDKILGVKDQYLM